ncbi:MAG: hypothetical protein WKF72_03170 [Nocardioidaceae bacterium]
MAIALVVGLIAGAGSTWMVNRDHGVMAGEILPSPLDYIAELGGTPLTVNLPDGVLEFDVADPVDVVADANRHL